METKHFCSSKTRMTAFFIGLILVFVCAPLLRSTPAQFWFHEHFFNSLLIAENFISKGFPTFDGITPTNDFSLIWTAILAGLSIVAPSDSTLFFILVRAVIGIALGITLLLFNKLIDVLNFKPEPQKRFLILSFLTTAFIYTGLTGSDAALAVPCVFFNALCLLKALKTPCFKTAFLLGLSVDLCAFARFDSIGFALTAALVFYFQFNKEKPITTKQLLTLIPGFIIALIPLMIWADTLQTMFGSPIPSGVTGWANVQNHSPWQILTVLFFEPFRYIGQAPGALESLTFPVLILSLTAYVSFYWKKQKLTAEDTVFYALIWYPILYLMIVSAVTFIALPEYAFYPLAIGGPVALLFIFCGIDEQFLRKEQNPERKKSLLLWLILGFCFSCSTVFLSLLPRSAFCERLTQGISEFTDKNPGVYAMSSGAGISSYMTNKRFVRLDGMAQDQQMQKFLNIQAPLKNVFKHYGVDYFIATNLTLGKQSCYSAREPKQNRFGGSNKGMSDWLCASPVFEKQVTPKIKLFIFKIDKNGNAVSE